MRRLLKAVGLVVAAGALAVAGAGTALSANDKPPNEGVCPGYDTGHLSASSQTSFTYTAPDGKLIAAICVKAGSIQQGNGPEVIVYDPPVASATFSHSSGKEISHFSVDLVDDETEEPCEPDYNGEEPGCGEPPEECPGGDLNGQEPGCGTPPVDPCPNGDTNGDRPGCADQPPAERCPPGEGPYDGKDGEPGNEECCPDADNNQRCDEATPPNDSTTIETETTPAPTEPTETTPTEPETTVPEEEKPAEEKPVTEKELEKELEEQAKGNGATKTSSAGTGVQAKGTLPHTGLPLLPVAALGALMTIAGWRLRKRS